MPKVQEAARNHSYLGLDVAIHPLAPTGEVFQHLARSQRADNTRRLLIPAKRMGHHVIRTSANTDVIQPVSFEEIAAGGPGETGMAMLIAHSVEQYVGM